MSRRNIGDRKFERNSMRDFSIGCFLLASLFFSLAQIRIFLWLTPIAFAAGVWFWWKYSKIEV